MNKITKIILMMISVLILLALAFYFYVRNDLYSPMSKETKKIVFEIEKGPGSMQIVDSLKKEGLVRQTWTMALYLKVSGYGNKLKSGTFLLDISNSPVKNIEIIVSGETALKKLTFLEGWTKVDMAEYLNEKGIVSKQDYLDATNKKWDYSFLEGESDLEGYLYPDTYYVKYNADADTIIKAQLDNFDKKLTQTMRDDIKSQGRTIKDVVILASIVEREVTKDNDRKIVAGIFLSRIKEGMPLQSDATVNYVTGESKASPTYEETRKASPYNTYLNKGLTPGPISNPSISSITSSVYPEYTDYRYYLNRQDTLETIFSVTYDEHLENKQKYLK
ncbi:endolytic transglycosylase MltG [bacterium]|nr:endolytic transglycosylase MltG [bacterium]